MEGRPATIPTGQTTFLPTPVATVVNNILCCADGRGILNVGVFYCKGTYPSVPLIFGSPQDGFRRRRSLGETLVSVTLGCCTTLGFPREHPYDVVDSCP